MSKRYNVCTPRPKGENETWWHRIGTAFQKEGKAPMIYLDSLPIPDKDGRVVLALFEPKPKDGQVQSRAADPQQPIDDEIPF